MKIYFEDGPLYAKTSLELGCDHIINAACGYSDNEAAFDRLLEEKPNCSVYTNSIVALINAQKYCWNKELEIFEIYLKRGNEFVRTDELTDKRLLFTHNIYCMQFAGVFKGKCK